MEVAACRKNEDGCGVQLSGLFVPVCDPWDRHTQNLTAFYLLLGSLLLAARCSGLGKLRCPRRV